MAVTYYLRNTNADTTCDAANTPKDLSQTQGSGPNSQQSSQTGSTSFTEVMSFDIDVGADGATGDHTISIDVSAVDAKAEYRFRVQSVNASCSVVNSSAYSSTFNNTGIKTLGPTNLTWGTADRLRLSIEIRKSSNGGNRDLTVNTEDADSTVIAPWSLALSATANQASETDSIPGALGKAKALALGAVTAETDTSQPLTSAKALALGAVTAETDTAQAVTVLKTKALGLASETDTSQPVTAGGAIEVAVGLASETDSIPGALGSAKTKAPGLSSETETSQPLTSAKQLALAATPSETGTAQTLSSLKALATGLASTTGTAQPITALKTKAIGLASESDSVPSVTQNPIHRLIGLVSETDVPQSVSGGILGSGPPPGLRTQALTGVGV